MAKGSKNDNSSSDKDNEGGEEPDPIWKSWDIKEEDVMKFYRTITDLKYRMKRDKYNILIEKVKLNIYGQQLKVIMDITNRTKTE
jgi:hypothetical protein